MQQKFVPTRIKPSEVIFLALFTKNLYEATEKLIDYIGTSQACHNATDLQIEMVAAEIVRRRCYYSPYEGEDEILIETLSVIRYGGSNITASGRTEGKSYSRFLTAAINELLDYIRTRESHLFSASAANLTRVEVKDIAAQIILNRCFNCPYENDEEAFQYLLENLEA